MLAGEKEWAAARERIQEIASRPDSPAILAAANDLGWVLPGEISPEVYPDTRARERILETLAAPGTSLLDRRIEAAILSLSPGKVSPILRSRRGYHLFYLEALRPADPSARTRHYARLRDDLLRTFQQGTWNALIRFLRTRYDIQRGAHLLELLSETQS
jgi:hypothetical protein